MLEKFHYTLSDGHEISLPRFENIEVGAVRKIRRLTQIDQIFTLIELYLDEDGLAHFDKMTRTELEAFAKAWREGSAVGPGESSASSPS